MLPNNRFFIRILSLQYSPTRNDDLIGFENQSINEKFSSQAKNVLECFDRIVNLGLSETETTVTEKLKALYRSIFEFKVAYQKAESAMGYVNDIFGSISNPQYLSQLSIFTDWVDGLISYGASSDNEDIRHLASCSSKVKDHAISVLGNDDNDLLIKIYELVSRMSTKLESCTGFEIQVNKVGDSITFSNCSAFSLSGDASKIVSEQNTAAESKSMNEFIALLTQAVSNENIDANDLDNVTITVKK